MKKAEYQRFSRRLKLPAAFSSGFEDIAHPAQGVNHLLLEVPVDLVSQPANDDVHDVGLGIETVVPHVLHDHRLGNDLARVAQQIFQQRKLARLQLDSLAPARHLARDQVQAQIADGQSRRLGRAAGAADQRLDPRQQFAEREGFYQVIIASALQALDAIIDRGFGAEDDDWQVDLL